MDLQREMSRRQILRGVLGAAAMLPAASVLAACSSGTTGRSGAAATSETSPASAAASSAAPAASTVKLKVGYLAAPSYGLFDVDQANKWFAANAVDPGLTLFASGPPLLQAMAGGSLACGMLGTIPPIITAAQGVFPLKIISVVEDASGLYSILADKSIKSVADLKGKKVAAAIGTDFQYILDLALQKYGMTESDIKLVDAQQTDAQAAFIGGQVDAVLPAAANRALIQQKRPDANVIFVPADFTKGPNPMPPVKLYDLLVAPASVVANQKTALTRFLQAYHGQIVPWALSPSTQPVAAAQIAQWQQAVVKSPTTAAVVTKQLAGYEFYDVAGVKKVMHGVDLKNSLQGQAQFLLKGGRIKSMPNLDDMIDASIVDALG